MDTAKSVNNVLIRLTNERWQHISIGHPEIADYYFEILETIESPAIIYEGYHGGLIAIGSNIEHTRKFIVVVYKEITAKDGFVITAYISNNKQKFDKKKIIWNQQ